MIEHLSDCGELCNGDWCGCPCHRVAAEYGDPGYRVKEDTIGLLAEGKAADWTLGMAPVAQGWTAEWELASLELGIRTADELLA